MPEETTERPKGSDPLTTSTLSEVLNKVKSKGVCEEDFREHPEIINEIVGADGKPVFKKSDIPEVKPETNPILSTDNVIAPKKASWIDDHAKAVVGEESPKLPITPRTDSPHNPSSITGHTHPPKATGSQPIEKRPRYGFIGDVSKEDPLQIAMKKTAGLFDKGK